jgi:hypothetical protein
MLITVYTLIIGCLFIITGGMITLGMALSTIDLILTYFLLKAMPMGFIDQYKWLLIPLLPVSIVLVNMYLDELLFSRALGGLFLILMAPVLDLARMNFSTFTPVLSLACYILIVIGMYLVCLPYLMRDFGSLIGKKVGRTTILSTVLVAYGIVLVGIAFVL